MNLDGEIRYLKYGEDSVQTMVHQHFMAQLQYRYILRL
jgi:hypothetical protein